jgi:hypothetical protein
VTGQIGATGIQGQQGVTGQVGATGIQGLIGTTGVQGIGGNTGLVGAQGSTGLGITGVPGQTGIAGSTANIVIFYADEVDSPNNANWAINNNAPASSDSLNNALLVRRFDDTAEEGIGWTYFVPTNTTNITFRFKARAQTAPGAARNVILRLYNRQIPDNAAVTAWSAALQLTTIAIPTNTNFQYDSQTISLATLGITAGRVVQFELTRFGASASDTLVGDFNLLEVQMEFS